MLINNRWQLIGNEPISKSTSSEVHEAYDTIGKRNAVLKLLTPPSGKYEQRLGEYGFTNQEVLLQEAVALYKLAGKRHIANIYDANWEGERFYIAEEFIEGSDLRQLSEQGLSIDRIVDLAIQISDGLSEAHAEDVVHNDLRPENIKVDGNGIVKLLDFGTSVIEKAWRIPGAIVYRSPESFQHQASPMSDVWQAGVLLYELLAGRRPFRGTDEEVEHGILYAQPSSPREHNPQIPEKLENIVLKCLEKDPLKRYQTTTELKEALERFAEKKLVHVVENYRDIDPGDEGRMGEFAGKLLDRIFEKKIAPLASRLEVGKYPYGIQSGKSDWFLTDGRYWTAGFWPGILWMGYRHTGDKDFLKWAEAWTKALELNTSDRGFPGLGINCYTSFVPAFEITGDEYYKRYALEAAETIASRFHRFESGGGFIQDLHEDYHKKLMISTLELELPLLLWALKETDSDKYLSIIKAHPATITRTLLRPNYSAREAAEIDLNSGEFIKETTESSFGSNTCISRAQARAIYGYGLAYQILGETEFLDIAKGVANHYLSILPKDRIPPYDFNLQLSSKNPKNTAATSFASYAFHLLSQITQGEESKRYRNLSNEMLAPLLLNHLSIDDDHPALLIGSCANLQDGHYMNSSLIYGDYYLLLKMLSDIKFMSHNGYSAHQDSPASELSHR